MASVGPGLIVMEADNDAGAVSTYVQEEVLEICTQTGDENSQKLLTEPERKRFKSLRDDLNAATPEMGCTRPCTDS
jgi:hypothetical protein